MQMNWSLKWNDTKWYEALCQFLYSKCLQAFQENLKNQFFTVKRMKSVIIVWFFSIILKKTKVIVTWASQTVYLRANDILISLLLFHYEYYPCHEKNLTLCPASLFYLTSSAHTTLNMPVQERSSWFLQCYQDKWF
jgi:hypothetical protein